MDDDDDKALGGAALHEDRGKKSAEKGRRMPKLKTRGGSCPRPRRGKGERAGLPPAKRDRRLSGGSRRKQQQKLQKRKNSKVKEEKRQKDKQRSRSYTAKERKLKEKRGPAPSEEVGRGAKTIELSEKSNAFYAPRGRVCRLLCSGDEADAAHKTCRRLTSAWQAARTSRPRRRRPGRRPSTLRNWRAKGDRRRTFKC